MNKKTLIIGVSENPARYSFQAVKKLLKHQHEVIAIGNKAGKIDNVEILTSRPEINNLNTITLYINPSLQSQYYDWIIQLNPQRVIFNPGTENTELEQLLKENKITFVRACTLVMLLTGQY